MKKVANMGEIIGRLGFGLGILASVPRLLGIDFTSADSTSNFLAWKANNFIDLTYYLAIAMILTGVTMLAFVKAKELLTSKTAN